MREFLGSLVRQQRIKLGLSLRELASKVGCVPSLLSEMENGLRPAPKAQELLEKLAYFLDIDLARVLAAAQNDQSRRNTRDFREMLARDDELAACYCRAKEEFSQEEFKSLLMEAFKKAFSQNKEG